MGVMTRARQEEEEGGRGDGEKEGERGGGEVGEFIQCGLRILNPAPVDVPVNAFVPVALPASFVPVAFVPAFVPASVPAS